MNRRGAALGALLVVVGTLWLLDALDVVDVLRWSVVLPSLVVALGVWMVVTGLRTRRADRVTGTIDEVAVLGERHVRADGRFDGGSVTTVLGDVEVDLRAAEAPASGSMTLAVTTVLGDTTVIAPASWRVRTEGPAVLCDVEVRRDAPPGADGPELVVRTFGLLGDITVR